MTKVATTTKYCSLPPNCIAAGHDKITNSFYAITKPHTVSFNIVNSSPESAFFNRYCRTCHFYKPQAEILKEIEETGVVPTPPKIMSFCEQNNVCNGSIDLQEYCMAGNKALSGLLAVKKTLPYLLWVWSYKAKGKNVWRIYALKDYDTSDGFTDVTLYPYLFPNVYSNPAGAICWRKTNGINKTPKDLLEAYYTFFSAPFNKETSPVTVDNLEEYVAEYDPFIQSTDSPIETQEFSIEPITHWILNPHPNTTLLYSNDLSIIKTFPPKVVLDQSEIFAKITDTETPSMFMVDINGYQCLKTGKLKGKSPSKLLFVPNV